MITRSLRVFWYGVSFIGLKKEAFKDKELMVHYNQMSFICSFGIILLLVLSWFCGVSVTYRIVVGSLVLPVYFTVIILNYNRLYLASKYVIAIGSPLWINGVYLLIAGYYAQSIAIFASIAIVYISFGHDTQRRNQLLLFNIGLFILTILYININGPVLGEVIDIPYDELLVFAGGFGWSVVVLYLFNKDKNLLVQNLQKNNVRLKNTTKELERFTYIASHDLKSPLRTIRSFISLIERDIDNQDYTNLHEKLSFVKMGADQMNFLVRDILELSRLNTFKKGERLLIDLNMVFQKSLYNLRDEIEKANANILCDHLPFYQCNELEFLMLFQNFVQNAIKYNESTTPEIVVTIQQNIDQMEIAISDNGIGISEEYFDDIFQYFKRLHNSDKYVGTGLGLGLCRQIINSYNGSIEVQSELGQGTTFKITLPWTASNSMVSHK